MSVWQRQKNWWSEVLWKPKNPHSLDQLKYQYQVLLRNPTVTEANKNRLVETFRCIAEILIWGDQNDSRVFDFFLEKNMQSFFLKTLMQKCGRYVCIQLLQTLNILFENIRNETSIYYLLSNNHVNSIIVLKLDFSDEEVLAYYISFIKTLSFKLNSHTIHFFYNEHLRDFPLYTEAIKFFNHTESMVRIAVRTLTLNVYKVSDARMLEFIRNKTATPYFSNLVWFIGNHVIELDECLLSQAHHLNHGRLELLVAEHLDHMHYINDIFSLNVESLNEVLIDHLLNRLLIPLYVYSLTDQNMMPEGEESPHISSTISLFLLAQVFLIISNESLVTTLAHLILTGDTSLDLPPVLQHTTPGHRRQGSYVRGFIPPEASLESSFRPRYAEVAKPVSVLSRGGQREDSQAEGSSTESQSHMREALSVPDVPGAQYIDTVVESQYVLIEASPPADSPREVPSPIPSRKQKSISDRQQPKVPESLTSLHGIPITSTVFLDALMSSLSVRTDDSRCMFSLCLFLAMIQNKDIHPKLLEAFSLKPKQPEKGTPHCNSELVTLLLAILDTATASGNSIRLVTLRLAIMLLHELLQDAPQGTASTPQGTASTPQGTTSTLQDTTSAPQGTTSTPQGTTSTPQGTTSTPQGTTSTLQDHHIALIESIYESAILQLRLFYKGPRDEIFLDMFEDEYNNEKLFTVKVPLFLQDAFMLLPPTDTPLTGIKFTRRLPCGETERARKAMRVFFAIRRLSQQMSQTEERELPLTMPSNSAIVGDIVDLNNCDLVACTVTSADKRSSHFMVVTETEFLLVDPDKTKLGCGIVHFIAFLQDVDIATDPADSCALYITVHSRSATQKRPALSARFQFEDHIRCVAARQCLHRSREHLRLAKMSRVAKLLHLPVPEIPHISTHSLSMPRPMQLLPDLPATSLTSHVSTSTVQRVFLPPSTHLPSTGSQEFEMTRLRPQGTGSDLSLSNEEAPTFDSQGTPSTGPSPVVELDTRVMEVSLHLRQKEAMAMGKHRSRSYELGDGREIHSMLADSLSESVDFPIELEGTPPSQDMPGAVTLAPSQDMPGAVTLAPPQDMPGAVTLAPSQAMPGAVTLAPPQDMPGAVTLAPPQDMPGAVTLVPPQDMPGAVTLVPPQDMPGAVTLAPPQDMPSAVTLAPPQDMPSAVTLAPSQDMPGAVTLAPSQDTTGAVTLAPSQAMPGAVTLVPPRDNLELPAVSKRAPEIEDSQQQSSSANESWMPRENVAMVTNSGEQPPDDHLVPDPHGRDRASELHSVESGSNHIQFVSTSAEERSPSSPGLTASIEVIIR